MRAHSQRLSATLRFRKLSFSRIAHEISTQNVRLDCVSRCIARRQIFPEIIGYALEDCVLQRFASAFCIQRFNHGAYNPEIGLHGLDTGKGSVFFFTPILSRLVLQCEVRRPEGPRPKRNQLRFGRCILIRYDCRTARLRIGHRQSGYPQRLPRVLQQIRCLTMGTAMPSPAKR